MTEKTKEQLKQELAEARRRVAELEQVATQEPVTDVSGLDIRLLQAVVNNLPEGVFVAEAPAGKPLFANNKAQELLGKGIAPDASSDELAEVYAAYRYGTDDLYPAPKMPLVRALSGESSTVNDMEIRKPDGERILLQVMGIPIFGEDNQAVASVAIFQDITQQKEAQDRIEAQQAAIQELSTPVIPIMDNIIVMPLVGNVDSLRARDITRSLLAGITQHRAKVVILDVTGVALMDTAIVNHLNKTIQAARLKGAQTIITGISDAVAEAIVDLGIDWSELTTLSDLQTGLLAALGDLGVKLSK